MSPVWCNSSVGGISWEEKSANCCSAEIRALFGKILLLLKVIFGFGFRFDASYLYTWKMFMTLLVKKSDDCLLDDCP